MKLKEIFPLRLRAAREMRGLTQTELGQKADCVSIAHLEAGQRLPSAKNIVAIATALNVSTDYLFGMAEHTDLFDGLTDEQIGVINALVKYWRPE